MEWTRPLGTAARHAFAQAMHAVVTAGGARPIGALERASLEAIGRHLLEFEVDPNDGAYAASLPADLAATLPDPALRATLMRVLMCLPLVGGTVDPRAVAVVEEAARQLDADQRPLDLLRYARDGRHRRFLARIVRNAAVDFWGKGGRPGLAGWLQIGEQALVPGRIRRQRVAARYQALEQRRPGSLGAAIYQFYRGNGWALPGEPGGMPEWFVVHECTHILTGYPPTTPQGEMLTAVFTGGAKRRNPMDWVMVPLMQWHLGANVASIKATEVHVGLLAPDAFFRSWRRGIDSRISLMDDPWSWWDVIDVPVEELRERYNIRPLPPALH